MSDPIVGAVENGQRAPVVLPDWSGMAGIRTYPETLEVAYLGDPPRSLPCAITIDGVQLQATERAKSMVAGMVVLIVPVA